MFIWGYAFSVWANTPCDGIHKPALGREKLTQIAGPIGVVPNRWEYAEYQKKHPEMTLEEVYQLFSFNGRMICGGTATASITEADNVLTSAAHVFYNEDCSPAIKNLKECYFLRIIGPDQLSEPYYVDSVEVGDKCPRKNDFTNSNDWAVVKLRRRVKGANKLILQDDCVARPGLRGMHFASMHADFGDQDNPPPTFGECGLVKVTFTGINLVGDCSAGGGASGGSFTCQNGNQFALAAIYIASSANPDWYNKPFHPGWNKSSFVPVDEKVRAAIKRAAGNK